MPLRSTYCNLLGDPFVTSAGNTIASFTGPQNLIKVSGGATYVAQPTIIPVNYLKTGTIIRTHASGTVANSSTTPTMTWQLTYGASTVLAITAVLTETSGATIQVPWWLDLTTVVRSAAIPSAVVSITHGTFMWCTTLSSVASVQPVPSTAAGSVATIDNTAAGELWVGATCSASAAGNTITLHTLIYEELTQI
jgi:hypothetical protein